MTFHRHAQEHLPSAYFVHRAEDLRSQAAHDLVRRTLRPVRRLWWELCGLRFGGFARIFAPAIASYRRRRNIRRLNALEDRILKDIGIRREDIREAIDRGRRRTAANDAVSPSARTAV